MKTEINVDIRTIHTNWDSAYIVLDNNGNNIGRVWYEEDTEWNNYIEETDHIYDFIDTFGDAVQMVYDETEAS